MRGEVVDTAKSTKIVQNRSFLPAFSHTQVGKSVVVVQGQQLMSF